VRSTLPMVPPSLEKSKLRGGKSSLAFAQSILGIEMMFIAWLTQQREQVFEIQHQVRPLIKGSERHHGLVEFPGLLPRQGVSRCRSLAKGLEINHLSWQNVANAGDRADRSTVDIPMKHLGIHADQEA